VSGIDLAIQGRKVVVVGDYILDRYHFCDATGVAGEGPMMALRHLRRGDFDGGAAVIALHAARPGRAGDAGHRHGRRRRLRQAEMRLRRRGLDVRPLRLRRDMVVKNRFLVDQTKLFKVDEGAASRPIRAAERALADAILAAAQGADAVIFADFGYGVISARIAGNA
jgi:bifunctional ADP-heptose synthase (sugar kinase/adenylyltransferase)